MTKHYFQNFHQIPFLRGFPDRKGASHYIRIEDGNYVVTGGWPSVEATHEGEWLGIPATNKKIKMTAPVMQQRKGEERNEVVFFLPRDLSAPPRPSNRDILIKDINMEVAVLAYKGGWKVKIYEENLDTLKSRLAENEKWKISGDPIWARYDPPWMPSFLRSNEIMLPVVRR